MVTEGIAVDAAQIHDVLHRDLRQRPFVQKPQKACMITLRVNDGMRLPLFYIYYIMPLSFGKPLFAAFFLPKRRPAEI